YFWCDGRHQYGPRRADDDRRLHHLGYSANLSRSHWIQPADGSARRVFGLRAYWHCHGARRNSVFVRPAVGNPAGYLRYQPDFATGGAQYFFTTQSRSEPTGLDEWLAGDQPGFFNYL